MYFDEPKKNPYILMIYYLNAGLIEKDNMELARLQF